MVVFSHLEEALEKEIFRHGKVFCLGKHGDIDHYLKKMVKRDAGRNRRRIEKKNIRDILADFFGGKNNVEAL